MFIIEADTPDELRLALIRIIHNNAERCGRNEAQASTKREAAFALAQKTAFLLLVHDLECLKIFPKATTN